MIDNIQKILTELDEFKGELSKIKKEEWQSKINELLKTSDGITALQERLEPEVKITRSILRMLVSQIKSRLDPSEPVADKDDLIRLLELLSENDRIDSDARWSALSVVLNTDHPNGLQIFANVLESITPQKDLSEKYKQYAFEHIIPDGGLPYLLDLYSQDSTKYEKWLPDLLEQVSDKLEKEKSSIDQRSLRTTLESVSKKLSEDSEARHWKPAVENRIKKVLSGDGETKPQLAQGEKAVGKKEEPASIPTGLEDFGKLLIGIMESQQSIEEKIMRSQQSIGKRIMRLQSLLENRDRIDQLQSQLKREKSEKAKLRYELDKTEQDYDEMIDELDQENDRLKSENAELREEFNKMQENLKKSQEEKEAQAKKYEDQIQEEKVFAENKIQREKNRADNLVSNFRDELGRKLYHHFSEAKDESYKPEYKEEKILLSILRDILRALEKSGVTIA